MNGGKKATKARSHEATKGKEKREPQMVWDRMSQTQEGYREPAWCPGFVDGMEGDDEPYTGRSLNGARSGGVERELILRPGDGPISAQARWP